MCQCKKNVKDSKQFTILPDDFCPICSEKHFSTAMQAMKELGYEDVNRNFIVGELELARKHIYKNKYLADKIRDIRHTIQYRRESTIPLGEWDDICRQLNRIIEAQLSEGHKKGRMIFFGKKEYPESQKLMVDEDDVLIFYGEASSAKYYQKAKRIIYHESSEEATVTGCFHYFLNGGKKNFHNQRLIDGLITEFGKENVTIKRIAFEHNIHRAMGREILLVNFIESENEKAIYDQYNNVTI